VDTYSRVQISAGSSPWPLAEGERRRLLGALGKPVVRSPGVSSPGGKLERSRCTELCTELCMSRRSRVSVSEWIAPDRVYWRMGSVPCEDGKPQGGSHATQIARPSAAIRELDTFASELCAESRHFSAPRGYGRTRW
jgi:hypothetical protein